ncbi:hypothetical protein OWV82_021619 [Melia azedarach]|uniref:Uncharacterized protein n=1 Tax=Melia azedarach TaxID=155640 RepID=A0ACC1X0Q3_MELAZ|nr:hypothetical protein OWV82_021619 [Melia azedarach]
MYRERLVPIRCAIIAAANVAALGNSFHSFTVKFLGIDCQIFMILETDDKPFSFDGVFGPEKSDNKDSKTVEQGILSSATDIQDS